jgi:hypothetical protein
MKMNLSLEIELDDWVTLPGRRAMNVVEVDYASGDIVLWDDVRLVEVNINVYELMRNLLKVERIKNYVLTP